MLFRVLFLDTFLDVSFPTFGLKWLLKKSSLKGLRRLWGAPGSQRRPKGFPKMSFPPRPCPGWLHEAPRTVKVSLFASILVHSGSILASNLASLSNLLASFSNVFRDLFLDTFLDASILGALFLDTDQANQRSASQNTTNHVT